MSREKETLVEQLLWFFAEEDHNRVRRIVRPISSFDLNFLLEGIFDVLEETYKKGVKKGVEWAREEEEI